MSREIDSKSRQDRAHSRRVNRVYNELLASHERLLVALWRSIEVMEFAYMNAAKQPKEIAEARAALDQIPESQKGA